MLTPDEWRYVVFRRRDPRCRLRDVGLWQCASTGLDPAIQLLSVRGNQYQALAGVAALDPQQAQHGIVVVGHAAEPEDAFSGVGDDAATE